MLRFQGRHEVFNETNREEVFAKLAGWLDVHVARRALAAEG